MTRRQRGQPYRPSPPARRTVPRWLLLGVGALLGIGIAVFLAVRLLPGGGQVAWARFDTADVHSLAFVGGDSQHLLFGHHGGLLESRDGGRTWSALPVRDDAMSMAPADDGSIVIAGHNVFTASRDGGATWSRIPADLPSLDIHGFTRDPTDPSRMWAYLATGGLWESTDGGTGWQRVREDNVLFPVAVAGPDGTRLYGITVSGLARSDDGGRTWLQAASPDLRPIASLAATADHSVLLAGGPDGLARSDDGGATWSALPFDGQVLAVAVAPGGRAVAVVTRSTEFFRSDDGGRTWPGP